jgi:hypothetical protein
MRCFRLILACGALAVVAGGGIASAAVIEYDLGADWSDTQNPFGQWSLMKSPDALFQVTQSDFWSNAHNQPSWADAYYSLPSYLPFCLKSILTPHQTKTYFTDFQIGDILVQGAEIGRTGTDVMSVVWTCPERGTAEISGAVWNVTIYRWAVAWELRANGSAVSGGEIGGGNGYGRSNPLNFSEGSGGESALLRVVNAGDQIELRFRTLDGVSDALGIRFRIVLTTEGAVSAAPSTWGHVKELFR